MSKAIVEAAWGRTPDRFPVWFLRQAGRYLPEYMQVRSKLGFVELCTTPVQAAEVTLQPLRRFDLDGAIIFSDILVTAMALGQELTFDAGHGPVLKPAIRDMQDVMNLRKDSQVQSLDFVGEAIQLVRQQLRPEQTMIGFAGAPFTVATYMIEGSGSKSFIEVKKLAWTQPQAMQALLERLTEITIRYLRMQVAAGAEYLMLFDTWANQMDPAGYQQWALPWVSRICDGLADLNVPICYYPGQGGDLLSAAATCRSEVIAVDWRVPLDRAIRTLAETRERVVVQGNLDPICLYAPETVVRQNVREVARRAAEAKAHIFNVGHGLTPGTPIDAINWVVDELRSLRVGKGS